jgi:hypothetical protein
MIWNWDWVSGTEWKVIQYRYLITAQELIKIVLFTSFSTGGEYLDCNVHFIPLLVLSKS